MLCKVLAGENEFRAGNLMKGAKESPSIQLQLIIQRKTYDGDCKGYSRWNRRPLFIELFLRYARQLWGRLGGGFVLHPPPLRSRFLETDTSFFDRTASVA